MCLLIARYGLNAGVGLIVKAGGDELIEGEVRKTLAVEGVFEMFESEGVVEDLN